MDALHPLRAYRSRTGVSPEEAAKALKISKAQLSRIETRKQLPQPGVILRIAAWTENRITANDLLGLKKRGRAA